MVVANVTRDAQNYLTDSYSLVTDATRIENLVRNAIIEFNKEKPQIHFPLYPVRSSLLFSSLFKFSSFSVIWSYYVVFVTRLEVLMAIVV